MNLSNNEIILRSVELDDATFLHALINDAETERALVGWTKPVSMHDQIEWIKNIKNEVGCVRYVISCNGISAGMVFLTDIDFKNRTAVIHIKLQENFRGKGIGAAAIKLLTEYAVRELNINCIIANILYENEASRKLFEKCGYVIEGVLRQRVYKNGKYNDLTSYSFIANK